MITRLKVLESKLIFYSIQVEFIRQSEFRRLADTGDILLFKSKSLITKVQRALTMSEYDHVAMLLRYSNSKLVILEATGTAVS